MAFDPGRRTGIAWWRPGWEQPKFLAVDMPDTRDIGIWSAKFRGFVLPFMQMEGVTDVVSEAPMIRVHQREDENTGAPVGRGAVDIAVVVFHVGILVTLEQVRAELKLPPVRRIPRASVAKHFTSSGKGKRPEIKARFVLYCQAQGWNHNGAPITDENIADAAGTLDMFLYEIGVKTPWDNSPRKPLFTAAGAAPAKARATNQTVQKAVRFTERGAA